MGEVETKHVIELYEIIEQCLKPYIITKVPEKYAEKIDEGTAKAIEDLVAELPVDQSEEKVTLKELYEALLRFISRNLLTGTMSEEGILMQFLPAREDFWPPNFVEDKANELAYEADRKSVV